MIPVILIFCLFSLFLLSRPLSAEGVAFPGADGFGAGAVGWKGTILTIENLADSGPGSLRNCAQNMGNMPRICVFRTGGTIDLKGPIFVKSNVYIAGQTAPGAGVQLRIIDGGHGPIIVKNAHDVVIRHLKLRPGPSVEPSATVDAITIENARRVMLDNLSMSFATDETFNIHVSNSTVSDVTLSDSILSFSLDRSNHPKGRHSKGALICSDEGPVNACGRISLLRNLFAHHRDRMPDVKGTSLGPIEIINNVFYNPISQFGEFYDLLGNARIAYVGNIAWVGPSTVRNTPEAVQLFDWVNTNKVHLFASDNETGAPDACNQRASETLDPEARANLSKKWDAPLSAVPLPSQKVMAHLQRHAGDQIEGRRGPDDLDQRALSDVMNCTGQVIDDVAEVGGWPQIPAIVDAARTNDTDGDGLPDYWEAGRPGLDPDTPDDIWDIYPESGLSFVETWLAELAGDPLE